MQKEASLLDFF